MADPTTAPPPTEHPKPSNVLHYLVVYPTLLLALGGSVPTIMQQVKAWRLETTASKVQLVEEQQKLWERNLECLQQGSIYEVDGPHSIVVRVTLCSQTGDTLLRYHLHEWPAIYRWVSLPVERVKK
jgi:hypothetical protein